jgi:hypothetical protein
LRLSLFSSPSYHAMKRSLKLGDGAAKGDANFPPRDREKMLRDLFSNYKLVGIKYSDLTKLLGTPDNGDSVSVSYEIELDYGFDIDPIYSKD